MAAPSLTVVVPCYNVSAFLPACLDSLFAQPGADRVKVVVVDDGSTDGSGQAAHDALRSHPGIDCTIVCQPNEGASGAKNTGLRLATTEYVTFVDGDDLVVDGYLAALLPRVEAGAADIIAFNATIVDLAGTPRRQLRVHDRACTDRRFPVTELADDAAALGEWQPCLRVFRTRLFDGLPFPPRRFYEDSAVLPQLYARATVIENLDQCLYLYRQRPGSITSTVTAKHIDDLLLNARETRTFGTASPAYWQMVRTRLLMQTAREIGRAPRALRATLAGRAWHQVRADLPPSVRGAWCLQLLDAVLRNEAKALLGRGPSPLALAEGTPLLPPSAT